MKPENELAGKTPRNMLDQLPAEVFDMIAEHLTDISFRKLRRTSRTLHRLCSGRRFAGLLSTQSLNASLEDFERLDRLLNSEYAIHFKHLEIRFPMYESSMLHFAGLRLKHNMGSVEEVKQNTEAVAWLDKQQIGHADRMELLASQLPRLFERLEHTISLSIVIEAYAGPERRLPTHVFGHWGYTYAIATDLFHTIMSSLAISSDKLTELDFFSSIDGCALPMNVVYDFMVAHSTLVFANLTSFKVSMSTPVGDPVETSISGKFEVVEVPSEALGSELQRCRDALPLFLSKMPNLTHLDFRLQTFHGQAPELNLSSLAMLPLQSCALRGLSIKEQSLFELLANCSQLQILNLESITLVDNSWRQFWQEMKETRIQDLYLHNIYAINQTPGFYEPVHLADDNDPLYSSNIPYKEWTDQTIPCADGYLKPSRHLQRAEMLAGVHFGPHPGYFDGSPKLHQWWNEHSRRFMGCLQKNAIQY